MIGPVLAACLLTTPGARPAPDPLPGYPPVMLWAWERPEDLRFLEPREAGVAFLLATVRVGASRWSLHPRAQPLQVSPATKLMAVVRIELSGLPAAPAHIAHEIAAAIAPLPAACGASALQIDFDATQSQRPFYRALAHALRERLPSRVPLTITALASWCAADSWLDGMPVADATPMYFRMGAESGIRQSAAHRSRCASSTGLSTDELVPVPLRGRLFLFNPRPWTPDALRETLSEVARWR